MLCYVGVCILFRIWTSLPSVKESCSDDGARTWTEGSGGSSVLHVQAESSGKHGLVAWCMHIFDHKRLDQGRAVPGSGEVLWFLARLIMAVEIAQ